MKNRAISNDRRERGFTLVELMVVIVLIGLFAGVVGVSVAPLIGKGRRTVALDQMKEIQKALELYQLETGSYPETLAELTSPTEDNEQGYLPNIPLDPWKENYEYDPAGGTVFQYELFSKGKDKQAGTDDDISLSVETEETSE